MQKPGEERFVTFSWRRGARVLEYIGLCLAHGRWRRGDTVSSRYHCVRLFFYDVTGLFVVSYVCWSDKCGLDFSSQTRLVLVCMHCLSCRFLFLFFWQCAHKRTLRRALPSIHEIKTVYWVTTCTYQGNTVHRHPVI